MPWRSNCPIRGLGAKSGTPGSWGRQKRLARAFLLFHQVGLTPPVQPGPVRGLALA